MVSMSSLDAINIDDGFDERDNTQTTYKPFHYVDELEQVYGVSLYNTNNILKQIETLPNGELEKVISHCNMLIERNNIDMGGV